MAKASADKNVQAFHILKWTFVLLPLLCGLDKFANMLANWQCYVPCFMVNMMGEGLNGWMLFFGIVQILIAIGVYFKPKLFGTILAIWFVLSGINFISLSLFYLAVTDFAFAAAAWALVKLSDKHRR